jgi:putative PIN family toxin of toxin-antitoxin system
VTVVLDTNVIVAAMVAEGLCREVVHRAVRMRILASSARLMDELEATLRRKFGVTPAARAFLKAFRQQIPLVEPLTLPKTICRDPDDDVVLATAIAANANLIVTGDRDLLVLEAYEGINIVSPRRFLEWLDAGSR